MASNPYDQECRYLAKLEPAPFLAWLLDLAPTAFHFRRWLDTRRVRFPGEPERTCDTVACIENVAAGQQPWAVPIEFQIEPDPEMFGRLLGYLGELWLEERPSDTRGDRFCLGAVVVNLTGRGVSTRVMSWPEAGVLTHLGVRERNLAHEDARTTLDAIRAGSAPMVVLPLIPLMQRGGETGIITDWIALASTETDARRRSDFGGLALIFAEAAGCHAAWKKALEGWNVIQSKQVLEWQAQARTETHAADLLEALQERLGPLPTEVVEQVRSERDDTVLRRWFKLALHATTLNQFLKDSGAGTNGTAAH